MHVKAGKVATAGLMVALAVVLLCMAAVIEMSSLFFIAAASFCVGIAIREWGLGYGVAFFVATTGIAFLVSPNKLYCITFCAMAVYLLGSEGIWRLLLKRKNTKGWKTWFWVGKYLLFNAMYIPTLLFFPKLLFAGKMNGLFFVLALLMGQIALFFYDMAHSYVQSVVWGKFKSFYGKEKI